MKHWSRKYLIAVLLISITFIFTIWLFPEWKTSYLFIIWLLGIIVVGVVSFIANWRQAFNETDSIKANKHIGNNTIALEDSIVATDSSLTLISDVHGNVYVSGISEPTYTPYQIPAPPADFTGREDELSQMIEKVNQGIKLFGIQGMGGVGKTTLALKFASLIRDFYPDGQFYIDLKGTSEVPLQSEEAMAKILRQFYSSNKLSDDEDDLRGTYNSVLHMKQAVLLLDNVADSSQVMPLIPPTSCLLIVTSRSHFTLPGLYINNLDCFPPEDARNLLLRIAPGLDIPLTKQTTIKNIVNIPAEKSTAAHIIAELCGYLPLALRLAASVIVEHIDIDAAEFIHRLNNTQTKLRITGVEASLETSYKLLNPQQKRYWRILSIFPETFDTAAAAAIWDISYEDARHNLNEFTKRSLIDWSPSKQLRGAHIRISIDDQPKQMVFEGTNRYLLHDLARLFAAKRLTTNETKRCQRRHAVHYEHLAQTAHMLYHEEGKAFALGLALFVEEWGNIQLGQKWAAVNFRKDSLAAQLCIQYIRSCDHILQKSRPPAERIRWHQLALQATKETSNHSRRIDHLLKIGNSYRVAGKYNQAIQQLQEALALSRRIKDHELEAKVLNTLSYVWFEMNDHEHAIELLEQALPLTRQNENKVLESTTLGNLGNNYTSLGDPIRAIKYHEQLLMVAREANDLDLERDALGNLGRDYHSLLDFQRAIDLWEQVINIDRKIGDRHSECMVLSNIGSAYKILGHSQKSISYFEKALSLSFEIGNQPLKYKALEGLADVNRDLGNTARAIEQYEQLLTLARNDKDGANEANVLSKIGFAYLKIGEFENALQFLGQSCEIYTKFDIHIPPMVVAAQEAPKLYHVIFRVLPKLTGLWRVLHILIRKQPRLQHLFSKLQKISIDYVRDVS